MESSTDSSVNIIHNTYLDSFRRIKIKVYQPSLLLVLTLVPLSQKKMDHIMKIINLAAS